MSADGGIDPRHPILADPWPSMLRAVANHLWHAAYDLDTLPPCVKTASGDRYEAAIHHLHAHIRQAAGLAGKVFDASIEQQWAEEDRRYAQYGTPLEAAHRGQYLAVSAAGETLLGIDYLELATRALAELGPGTYLVQVGEQAVGTWLWERIGRGPTAFEPRTRSDEP